MMFVSCFPLEFSLLFVSLSVRVSIRFCVYKYQVHSQHCVHHKHTNIQRQSNFVWNCIFRVYAACARYSSLALFPCYVWDTARFAYVLVCRCNVCSIHLLRECIYTSRTSDWRVLVHRVFQTKILSIKQMFKATSSNKK